MHELLIFFRPLNPKLSHCMEVLSMMRFVLIHSYSIQWNTRGGKAGGGGAGGVSASHLFHGNKTAY